MRVVTWENQGGKRQVLYCILSHFTAILLTYFHETNNIVSKRQTNS